MRAYCLIRPEPVYRRDAFLSGLKAAGYTLAYGEPRGLPGDALVLWNRYGVNDAAATRFEVAGGTVIVAENGYIAEGGVSPHSMGNRDVYALARHGHNGSGRTPGGSVEKWGALGIELQPWRTTGRHVLVCPNRSFGRPGYIMPTEWPEETARRLRGLTKREVRIRPHPGNSVPGKPLADDLRDCWAVVIWASSAGVHAIIAGVPVIAQAPAWVAMGAAGTDLRAIENPPMPDRLPVMHKIASAQWHIDEIESGEAFRRLV